MQCECNGCSRWYARTFSRCPFCNHPTPGCKPSAEAPAPPQTQPPGHGAFVAAAASQLPAAQAQTQQPTHSAFVAAATTVPANAPGSGVQTAPAQQAQPIDHAATAAAQARAQAIAQLRQRAAAGVRQSPTSAGADGRRAVRQKKRARPLQRMVMGWLVKAGGGCIILGLITIAGTCALHRSADSVDPRDLLNNRVSRRRVSLKNSLAAWTSQISVDVAKPIELPDMTAAIARSDELRGRRVRLGGVMALSAMILRSRVTYTENGQSRTEVRSRPTRIYAPVLGTKRRLWVLSNVTRVTSVDDPQVTQFMRQGTYTGVLRPLSSTVDLKLVRNARVVSGKRPGNAIRFQQTVPSDAVAIVGVDPSKKSNVWIVAPVSGTQDGLWVAARRPQPPDATLAGDYDPCPSRRCAAIADAIKPAPRGVIWLRESYTRRGSPLSFGGILFLLTGGLMIYAGLKGERWLP